MPDTKPTALELIDDWPRCIAHGDFKCRAFGCRPDYRQLEQAIRDLEAELAAAQAKRVFRSFSAWNTQNDAEPSSE